MACGMGLVCALLIVLLKEPVKGGSMIMGSFKIGKLTLTSVTNYTATQKIKVLLLLIKRSSNNECIGNLLKQVFLIHANWSFLPFQWRLHNWVLGSFFLLENICGLWWWICYWKCNSQTMRRSAFYISGWIHFW